MMSARLELSMGDFAVLKKTRKLLLAAVAAFTVTGCATTALRLMKPSDGKEIIAPTTEAARSELKDRGMELGAVYLDPAAKGQHVLPDEAYIKLFRYELLNAFGGAGLDQGHQPSYTVNLAVEQMKFVSGGMIIPNPSRFRVRMEIIRPDETTVMRGAIECIDTAGVPVPIGGIMTPVAIPQSSSVMAHSKLIPAMASLVATVSIGLKEGKTLDAIKIFPYDSSTPQAEYVLSHSKLGLRRLTRNETEEITGLRLKDYEKNGWH